MAAFGNVLASACYLDYQKAYPSSSRAIDILMPLGVWAV